MARMEMGIAASITCPTFKPEYAEAMVKITQSTTPHRIDRGVSSGTFASVRTTGR
jgi:hypothetical protein